jgi:hypothetical protein
MLAVPGSAGSIAAAASKPIEARPIAASASIAIGTAP